MMVIINYGLGNLRSIQNMCRRLAIDATISSDAADIMEADRLLLPGVGHFKQGMDNLKSSGLQQVLNEVVLVHQKPILGICLGAQLMTRHSEEGDVDGLGWIDATTVKFDSSLLNGLKVPHMGWSDVTVKEGDPLWNGLPAEPRFYHVHTYHFLFQQPAAISATATYGYEFPCAFRKNNIYGTQFHPEKSHRFGMKVIDNFSKL